MTGALEVRDPVAKPLSPVGPVLACELNICLFTSEAMSRDSSDSRA